MYSKLDQEFMEKTCVIVRVYIIEAMNLTDMDTDGHSDPFLSL